MSASRVDRSPTEIRAAAPATASSGDITRRAAARPSSAPTTVVSAANEASAARSTRSESSTSRADDTSKYDAPVPPSGTPTTITGSPCSVDHAQPAPPPSTRRTRSPGTALGAWFSAA
ncbi:hypothetical protein GCM10025868_18080 [Angustibacter aerolatus]|uniref:Uncharacterized protein n=1 Tax=Angustibacter aerolatus TaxID=1162965 RepID=A0ABQ6JEE1_9ACTN|nr:hypothetical protein GCM10025868_18080 [Angustibacter aerolatus]